MIDKALTSGRRIGVLATVAAGLEQQRKSIEGAAKAAGKEIEIVAILRPDAFAALNAGDEETHDRILLEELNTLVPDVDVVVLAQASMAGLLAKVPAETPVPVLASPQLAVEKVKEILKL